MVRKILLHICCAPCAIGPLEKLKSKGFEVEGFWYNPNIHPYREYQKRKKALRDYADREKIPLLYGGEYGLEEFLRFPREKTDRCPLCYRLRLERTAQTARERNCSGFSSTLLGSPHQRHELVREIAQKAAKHHNADFVYQDFRSENQVSLKKARELGLYCQNYCGCIWSEYERFKKN